MPTRRPFAATNRHSPSKTSSHATGRQLSGSSGWAPRASTSATANAFSWGPTRPSKHRNASRT
eukprot:3446853-Lingulodinium_polyedra.AAC.1